MVPGVTGHTREQAVLGNQGVCYLFLVFLFFFFFKCRTGLFFFLIKSIIFKVNYFWYSKKETYYVAQAVLERARTLLVSAFWVLGIQVCGTTPGCPLLSEMPPPADLYPLVPLPDSYFCLLLVKFIFIEMILLFRTFQSIVFNPLNLY